MTLQRNNSRDYQTAVRLQNRVLELRRRVDDLEWVLHRIVRSAADKQNGVVVPEAQMKEAVAVLSGDVR